MGKGRKFSHWFMRDIALRALAYPEQMSQLCRQYDLNVQQVRSWITMYADGKLEDEAGLEKAYKEDRIPQLYQLLGEAYAELALLNKALQRNVQDSWVDGYPKPIPGNLSDSTEGE